MFETIEKPFEISPKVMENKYEWIVEDVLVIILMTKNANFKGTLKPYELELYGKKMWEWVALCADDCVIKTTTCTEESDILSLIKPHLTNAKYTVVFYSDTPLLTRETFLEIMDFMKYRQKNVLKLTRGYVFNTEYIKTAENIVCAQTEYFNEEDFLTCYDNKQLALIGDILKNRILDFHLRNGVQIDDLGSTFIDSDVVIEAGARIMPHNMIKGASFIGKNCVIGFSNYIENSIIAQCSVINQSTIIDSKISENMVVGPFENVRKKSV